MIITDPETVMIIAIATIIFLAVSLLLIIKVCNDKFEKIGFTMMFSVSIISVFINGVLQI